MRVLVNFQHRDGWFVSSLAEDCRTVVGPFVDVASLDTLRRLLHYAGADKDAMEHFEYALGAWGKGSVWIDKLTDEGARLLRIRVQKTDKQ
jgi:hypothetical protein